MPTGAPGARCISTHLNGQTAVQTKIKYGMIVRAITSNVLSPVPDSDYGFFLWLNSYRKMSVWCWGLNCYGELGSRQDSRQQGRGEKAAAEKVTKEIPKTEQKWHLNKSCEHKIKLANLK